MFRLKETESSVEFSGRVTDVFAALGTGSVKTHQESPAELRENSKRPDFDKQQLARAVRHGAAASRKSERTDQGEAAAAFKRPAPISRRVDANAAKLQERSKRFAAGPPDPRRNPRNWTKYSLADVTTDQLSDRSNTSAALDFLKELRRGKAAAVAAAAGDVEMAGEEDEEPAADLSQPITFRKPPAKSRPKQQPGGRRTAIVIPSVDDEASPANDEDGDDGTEEDRVAESALLLASRRVCSAEVGAGETGGPPSSGGDGGGGTRKSKKKITAPLATTPDKSSSAAIKLSHLDDEED